MPAVANRLTLAELQNLPAALSPTEAARLLSVSRTAFYDALKSGRAPVEPIKVGGRTVIPTAPLLRVIGIEVAVVDRLSAESGR